MLFVLVLTQFDVLVLVLFVFLTRADQTRFSNAKINSVLPSRLCYA